MRQRTGEAGVRTGPIALITLVIVLSLATLAILTLTTARAADTVAAKQLGQTQALYKNEGSAWDYIAEADSVLAQRASENADYKGDASEIASKLDATDNGDGSVTKTFKSESRTLTVTLEIDDGHQYRITRWSAATEEDTEEQIGLWAGTSN